MLLRQPNEFLALQTAPSGVGEIQRLAGSLSQTARRTRVSLRFEPQIRDRQGKPVSSWPDINWLIRQLAPHPQLRYELVFGLAAVNDRPQTLRNIIDCSASTIQGLVWKGRPSLAFLLNLAIDYPWLNQTIKVHPSEMNRGGGSEFNRQLNAWKACGIRELLIPVKRLNSRNFDRWRQAIDQILRQGCFALRLEHASEARQNLIRKILLTRGYSMYGFEADFQTLKPLFQLRHQAQQSLEQIPISLN